MTPTITKELARMAEEIADSERFDLAYVLDYLTAVSLMLQGFRQEPELVAFLRAIGKKVSESSAELRVLEPLIREKVSHAAGDEIGRIWGDPNLVQRGS